MRRIWIVTVAVAVAISATTVAQSKRNQSRIKQPPAQVTESESGKEQPQQPPIIVNVAPALKTDAERAEEAEERRSKSETDAKLAEYTRELALFTKGLFYATTVLGIATIGLLIAAFIQSREMKKSIAVSDKIAETAMKSANVAEQALLVAETPYLVPEITDCRIRTSADSIYEVDLGNTVTFHIHNYGRTPATIYDIYSCLFPAYALPEQIDTTGLHT